MDRRIRSGLWWLCLLVAPVVLAGIELFHPAGFTREPGMYAYLSQAQPYSPAHVALDYPGPGWWFMLHMVQTPLVGLVAIGLWMIADEVDSSTPSGAQILAWIGRLAVFVFLIYYTVLDSIGGIGLGRSLLIVHQLAADGHLSQDQVAGVALMLNTLWTDPIVGGVGSVVSQTGSWAVFAAALGIGIALLLADRSPWPPAIILVAFGWELQVSHASPHGPIAFALLIVAAAWLRLSRRDQTVGRMSVATSAVRQS